MFVFFHHNSESQDSCSRFVKVWDLTKHLQSTCYANTNNNVLELYLQAHMLCVSLTQPVLHVVLSQPQNRRMELELFPMHVISLTYFGGKLLEST